MLDLSSCALCPRLCHANRTGGHYGFCGVGDKPLIARAAPHLWEEPCLCGEKGSGTVFFGGCNLGCVFCQNRTISREPRGKALTEEELAALFLSLQTKGVSNINLVTPTPWVLSIRRSLDLAWQQGLYLPIVYNCGGYEQVEAVASLRGYISIYLPDFKYWDPTLGKALSGIPDYPERAKEALREMVTQRGEPHWDGDGLMTRGVIVRHLVLPGQIENSKKVLSYLHHEYGNSIYVSIMRQYTPMPGMTGDLARPLSEGEYDEVVDFAYHLGMENAFLQEGEAVGESFIPTFDGEGVL